MKFNYATEYDGYWSSGDRFGEQSFPDADILAEEILLTCGGGKVLDIGSGMGQLVRGLLRLGVDAYGVDVSQVAVAHANQFAPDRFHCASVLSLPFESSSFDTVISTDCLEHLSENDVVEALREIKRVARRSVFLRIATTADRDGHWHLTIQQRAWWEQRFFEAGFRKHPSYYQVNQYEALEHDGWQITVVLECIPEQAHKSYPLQALAGERDLHMDMLRETGARSDAHVARYQWATKFIRPGDIVLDAACGLGYGSYVLQRCSTASRTIGIDGSEYAIEYARQCFADAESQLEFRRGLLPEALFVIPDSSIDIVVSFETLEHVEDSQQLLAEFHRVLTPGGRIVVSVPNDWSDESGIDPNPFHLHVYTLERLHGELTKNFILEALCAQTASQCKAEPERKVWRKAGRSLTSVPLKAATIGEAPEAEWWLAVAMRNPLDGAISPYRESAYPTFTHPAWNVTAFARDYENPWLIRSIVDVGHRFNDRDGLRALAENICSSASFDSPDYGAALCVLAYQILLSEATSASDVAAIDQRIIRYIDIPTLNPHGIRWKISLLFVLGKLWMQVGNFSRAIICLEQCAAIDPLQFSPLLSNRTIEARLILGMLCIAQGDKVGALNNWKAGIKSAEAALRGEWSAAIGDLEAPAEFGLPELASILEYASSCAYSLAHIDEIDSKYWWWLHPRRDRLSQARMVSRRLDQALTQLRTLAKAVDFKQNELAVQGEYINAFKADIDMKQQELATQGEHIISLVDKVDAKQRELALQGEHITALKADIGAKQQELATQGEHITSLVAQIDAKQRELALQGEHITALKVDISTKQQELVTKNEHIASLQATCLSESQHLQAQINRLEKQLNAAEQRLNRVPKWLRKYL